MPNYLGLEKELLDQRQSELVRASRAPALAAQDDAALYALIAEIDEAIAKTHPAAEGAEPGLHEVLVAASRRLAGERRKRKLPAKPEDTPSEAVAAARPAAKTGKRAPASPARKPAGRAKAETRKSDLRTGSRRVAKAKTKTSAASAAPVTNADPAEPTPAAARNIAGDTNVVAAGLPTGDLRSGKAAKQGDTSPAKDAEKLGKKARKAAEKAAKQADKDADKALRKAAKKVEKAARKLEEAARKAEAKAAKKAARKADGKSTPSKKKGGKKADNSADRG